MSSLPPAGTSTPARLRTSRNSLIKDYNNEIKEKLVLDVGTQSAMLRRGLDTHTGYIDIVKAQTPETIAAFARQILPAGNKVRR